MVHASALFTRNIYLPYINPKATDKDLLRVGRISSIFIVAIGLVFAFVFPSVIHGLIEVWKVTAYLGIAFWFGVIWRRANRYGAWASSISMAAASLYTDLVLGWSLPEQILLYLPVGIVMMWVVSFFSRPEPKEKLRQFYMLLDTPVGREQRLRDANVEIKLEGRSEPSTSQKFKESKFDKILRDTETEDGLLIVDFLSLKKRFTWKRYRIDIIGFLTATGIALFLILSAMWLANIGA